MDNDEKYLFGHIMLMNLVAAADGELSADEVSVIYTYASALGVDARKFASLMDKVKEDMSASERTVGELCLVAMALLRDVGSKEQLVGAYQTYELIAHSDGLTENEERLLDVIRKGWDLPTSLEGFGVGTKGVAQTLMDSDLVSMGATPQPKSSGCGLFVIGAASLVGALWACARG